MSANSMRGAERDARTTADKTEACDGHGCERQKPAIDDLVAWKLQFRWPRDHAMKRTKRLVIICEANASSHLTRRPGDKIICEQVDMNAPVRVVDDQVETRATERSSETPCGDE